MHCIVYETKLIPSHPALPDLPALLYSYIPALVYMLQSLFVSLFSQHVQQEASGLAKFRSHPLPLGSHSASNVYTYAQAVP